MSALVENKPALTNLQLELLKSLKYMTSEEQVAEVKSLLRYYFAQKLDAAIDKTEKEKKYSADIYERWLKSYNSNERICKIDTKKHWDISPTSVFLP